ncbi:MAG: lasso RiPP family leader peptide-containing protein [Rhodobacteraceae bacterium]|nr:lasso RiPP family leader peptide-containing protein [Paracoccaceae bacterium]
MKKAIYTAPVLRAHGSVESVTKGGACGRALDADFPIGTPFDQLTCS